MNGAQDLGGRMGFGPVAPERDEPLFHADWEKGALAVTVATGACGEWGIDASRHARETLPPHLYLSKSYYDIWISGLEKLLERAGMVSAQERAAGHALGPAKASRGVGTRTRVVAAMAKGAPYDRAVSTKARFAPGARVRAKVMHPQGHTRLPLYARGKLGVVETVRGAHVFPDTHAHGKGEDPQWLYTVRFAARDLWGPDADAGHSVSIDAFEPYLDPA